jgi:hypothetical protein
MIKLEIYAIVIVVLVAIGGMGLHSYNAAIERAQVAEADARIKGQALMDQREENVRMKAAAEITDKINAARRSADVKKADLERMVHSAIQTVYAKSPEARQWADTPVPGDVLASLRNPPAAAGGSAQDSARAAAGPVDGRNAGAGAARQSLKWPAARLVPPDAVAPK